MSSTSSRPHRLGIPTVLAVAVLAALASSTAHAQTAAGPSAPTSDVRPIDEPTAEPASIDDAETDDAAVVTTEAAPVESVPAEVVVVQPPAEEPEEPAARVRASLDRGFAIESGDGRFGLQIGALIQYRIRADEDASGEFHPYFNAYNVRPQIRMHAFGDQLRVFIQPEFGGPAGETARLLDLELTYQPRTWFRIRAGQFLTPYSRAYLTPIPVMQFSNFGPANDAFRLNRDTGVMVFGTPLDGKLEYDVGIFNGNGIDRRVTDPVRWLAVARFQVAPLGAVPYDGTPHVRAHLPLRVAFAANGYAGQLIARKHAVDPATGNPINIDAPRRDFQSVGGDFVLNVARLHLTGESYYRHDFVHSATPGAPGADVRSAGGQVQAGWYVPRAKIELATRIAFVDPDLDARNDYVWSYEGGVHFYAYGNHAKFRLNYQHVRAGGNVPVALGYFGGRQERLLFDVQVFF